MPKATTARSLYQLKVVLEELEPAVWRRLLVAGDIKLDKLHYALQDAFGWTNSHLHCFEIGEQRYGMADVEEDADDLKDERVAVLRKVVSEGANFCYEYDYGDGWRHRIDVEKVVGGAEIGSPICLDGRRACPPEDVGGPGGYEEFVKAIADRKHERHREMLDWFGSRFDPETFDLADANAALRSSRTEQLTRRAMRRG
jgi:hypothetical protein